MSTPSPKIAQAPKRKRGHDRVAAIKKMATTIFTEKGYEAATMTEIAERSGTAIASLYRFFPSKEVLADALLLDYAQFVLTKLEALQNQTSPSSPERMAKALIDFRLGLQAQRRFAISLVDTRGLKADLKQMFRENLLKGLAGFLHKNIPHLTQSRSEIMASALLHVLKGVSETDQENPARQKKVLAELEILICQYLAHA